MAIMLVARVDLPIGGPVPQESAMENKKLVIYIMYPTDAAGRPFLVMRRTTKNHKGKYVTGEEFLKLGVQWPNSIAKTKEEFALLLGHAILDEVEPPTYVVPATVHPTTAEKELSAAAAAMAAMEMSMAAAHWSDGPLQILLIPEWSVGDPEEDGPTDVEGVLTTHECRTQLGVREALSKIGSRAWNRSFDGVANPTPWSRLSNALIDSLMATKADLWPHLPTT